MDLAQMGALVVQGNHDALVGGAPGQPQSMANVSVPWTRSQLSAQQQAFLRDLPLTARVGDVLLVHASARFPEKWYYVEDALTAGASLDAAQTEDDSVRFVFGGHVHRQSLYYRSTGRGLMLFNPTPGVAVPTPRHREWIATVGSVGQPRDGNPRAQYAMFDTDKAQLTFFRVEYDLQAAAAAIRQAGLLDFFAQRLEEGI